jgi:hypothetical protein
VRALRVAAPLSAFFFLLLPTQFRYYRRTVEMSARVIDAVTVSRSTLPC